MPSNDRRSGKRSQELQAVERLLRAQSTLTLSTISDDQLPYATPLFYLPGEELELYWFSSSSSRHSCNVLAHPQTSVAIYHPTDSWKQICGVQMQGRVAVVTDPALRRRIASDYRERFKLGSLFRLAMAKSKLYVFHPLWLRYLDNRKRFGYKFEITLEEAASSET